MANYRYLLKITELCKVNEPNNMAEHDIIPCYDDEVMFDDRKNNVTDLHAYYMTQFNLELENSHKKKDSFKYGVEESFDFDNLDNWNSNNTNAETDFAMIDQVIDCNINDQNIKEVLLDLDSIDFDEKSYKTDSLDCNKEQTKTYESNDYIDDESLIDELCREEESRLTPDGYRNENLNSNMTEKNLLPSIDTVFSKRHNFNYEEIQISDYSNVNTQSNTQINSIEHYSYPNNILYNLDNNNRYILPDTPTSCNEFTFDKNERKISITESLESDVHSSSYYDENSENFDEEDLFINLDDFGIHFEGDNENSTNHYEKSNQSLRKNEKDKSQGKNKLIKL